MAAASGDDSLWFRRFAPASGGSVRLICFPHAGGSAAFFFSTARALARAGIEVAGVQYPGRQDRRSEPGITDIGVLADRITEVLLAQSDHRPVALFGHSMGAVTAFEVARRLERDNAIEVLDLFVSGRRAPSIHRDENVHEKSDEGIVAELKQMSGTDASLLGDEEMLRMILPAIRADYTAVERYRGAPGAMVKSPIQALTGDADPKAMVDEVRVWSDHTSAGFDIRVFPGGHFYLTHHQDALHDLIGRRLRSGR